MGFLLRDIIDLEFLLGQDEEASEDLSARDRDIFMQINSTGLDDAGLVKEWLSYRKLLFFHETSPEQTLPGTLFASLMGWSARGLFAGGLLLGLATAYAFLAYHGTRPVNVTVFITLFILLQALLSFMALWVMARQAMGPVPARPGLFHTLISGLFFKKLEGLIRRAGDLPGGKALTRVRDGGALLGKVNRAHRGILFWPFFLLSTLLALGFSCGALGGTLFRVAVTDLAFGWQSTLVASGSMVHDLVTYIALPWSWALPGAVPDPVQIEGSRIILKEGMAGLATEHLTAWWPFLCMGLLIYGVLFRLAVALLAFQAQASALARMDLDQPRFRRLLVRMRTPNMETARQSRQASSVADRSRPPRPDEVEPGPSGDRADSRHGHPEDGLEQRSGDGLPRKKRAAGTDGNLLPCLVLASEQAFPDMVRDLMVAVAEDQLGIEVRGTAAVSFDFEEDREILASLAADGEGLPVIFFQEVWQPPIRGLLHYYTRVKTEVFAETPVWILLTGTPGEGTPGETPGVAADDMNYRVWKKAVSQLAVPDLVLERILP